MKNKVITYFLISIFVFSTIGIPITLHHCNMMHSVSLNSCGMCERKPSNCCDKELERHKISSIKGSACCDSKIIAQASNEKYVLSSYEFHKIDSKILLDSSVSENLTEELISKRNIISDISPPYYHSTPLYLFNSILLI